MRTMLIGVVCSLLVCLPAVYAQGQENALPLPEAEGQTHLYDRKVAEAQPAVEQFQETFALWADAGTVEDSRRLSGDLWDMQFVANATEMGAIGDSLVSEVCVPVSNERQHRAISHLASIAKLGALSDATKSTTLACLRDFAMDPNADLAHKMWTIGAMPVLDVGGSATQALSDVLTVASASDYPGRSDVLQWALGALGSCGAAGADVLLSLIDPAEIEEPYLYPLAWTGDARAYPNIQQYIAQKDCDFQGGRCRSAVIALANLGLALDQKTDRDAVATAQLAQIRAQLRDLCAVTNAPRIVGTAAVGLARITPVSDVAGRAMLEGLRTRDLDSHDSRLSHALERRKRRDAAAAEAAPAQQPDAAGRVGP